MDGQKNFARTGHGQFDFFSWTRTRIRTRTVRPSLKYPFPEKIFFEWITLSTTFSVFCVEFPYLKYDNYVSQTMENRDFLISTHNKINFKFKTS